MPLSTASPNPADERECMPDGSNPTASRLSSQPCLWKETLRFNLHPSIAIPDEAHIADVARRSALWLTDVACEYPAAQLDGFPIDTTPAPLKDCLPPNTTLKTWNLFEDVPDQLIGMYDLVHVRLLAVVVRNSDPRDVVRSLLKLLKPGGYIQWDELNYPGMVNMTGRCDCTNFFAKEGLLDTMVYSFEDLPTFPRANGEQHLLEMEKLVSGLAETDHREETTKILRLMQDVKYEVLNGAALAMPRIVCVGRKASVEVGRCRWYKASIGPRLKSKIRKVFQTWAGLSDNELVPHLHRIRDKAWMLSSYPCIGEWIFLLPSISNFPEYAEVVVRAQAGDRVLDLGCGFGQDLRLLAADGACPQNFYASDIKKELWDLGFELFNDRDRMVANFIQANILDENSDLAQLNGTVDVIIANQFIHLFDWEAQVLVLKTVVQLSKPRTILIGYQRAQVPPRASERPWGNMYFHDDESYRKLWQRVELETKSIWDLSVKLVDLSEWGMEEEDCDWMPEGKKGINFVVTRRS